MGQYVARAEVLRDNLKTNRPLKKERNQKLLGQYWFAPHGWESIHHTCTIIIPHYVDQIQDENPPLKEALEFARRADRLEEHRLYHGALELYKEAIESLLPLVG